MAQILPTFGQTRGNNLNPNVVGKFLYIEPTEKGEIQLGHRLLLSSAWKEVCQEGNSSTLPFTFPRDCPSAVQPTCLISKLEVATDVETKSDSAQKNISQTTVCESAHLSQETTPTRTKEEVVHNGKPKMKRNTISVLVGGSRISSKASRQHIALIRTALGAPLLLQACQKR